MTTRMDDSDANRLLNTAVANVQRDYPVHWTHFVHSSEDLVPQRTRHPVFAGSYDWHSCVHQTWLIVRLLRLRPDLPDAVEAATVLVVLRSGQTLSRRVDAARGGLDMPLADADLEAKLEELAEYGGSGCAASPLIDALWALESAPDASLPMRLASR